MLYVKYTLFLISTYLCACGPAPISPIVHYSMDNKHIDTFIDNKDLHGTGNLHDYVISIESKNHSNKL
jgi:hypothetical protein